MRSRSIRMIVIMAALALVAAACQSGGTDEATSVKLQLQWVPQSQFAGYYAALDQGYYAEEGLEVTILPGGPDIVPQQVVAQGNAEYGLAWVPKALISNEEGAGLVNIGQVFQRSATLQLSWKDSGITSVDDFAGRNVGSWLFGNELEQFAAMRQAGLDPDTDVNIIGQGFDMLAFLRPDAGGTGEIEAAQAMTYNEYAQVLEVINPATGELFQPEDLNIISYNDVGSGMLQDAVWAQKGWLDDSTNQETSVKFLRASYRGWIFCRDNFDACVDIVLAAGTQLGKSHMQWQLNEINALIWPSPLGIGTVDAAEWAKTVQIALDGAVISSDPGSSAYDNSFTEQALADISEDTLGTSYQKRTDIVLQEGGT